MAINELPITAAPSLPNWPPIGNGLPPLNYRIWKVANYSIHHRRTPDPTGVPGVGLRQTSRHMTLYCDFAARNFNDAGFGYIRNWDYVPNTERIGVGSGNGNIEYFVVSLDTWHIESLDVQIEGSKGVLTAQLITIEEPTYIAYDA
jgi:hypothetical protein